VQLTVKIASDNEAAVYAGGSGFAAEALREIGERLDGGAVEGIVRDPNGNRVGSWALMEGETEAG
jgi:hypothetical protein